MGVKTKVLVVSASAVGRKLAIAQLAQDPSLEVMAAVSDPTLAMERMRLGRPDVIVLDAGMPPMDRTALLRALMAERPTPVVMCSTGGATNVLAKSQIVGAEVPSKSATALIAAVRSAAHMDSKATRHGAQASVADPAPKLTADAVLPASTRAVTRTTERFVAIGSSTGGTEALEEVLMALPRACPGIVIVQHMPEKFTASFAQRLDGRCRIDVKEAAHGDRVSPGRALIAPGGKHMFVRFNGTHYQVNVVDGPVVNRHRPSVDVLFRSVAQQAARNAMGIIMTGMGDDGARGMKEMHDAGARTVAQDEATCVVYGMPKEAVKLGAVDQIIPLDEIAREILRLRGRGGARPSSEVNA